MLTGRLLKNNYIGILKAIFIYVSGFIYMENYAGSSTLLIFDVASASFIAGISIPWLLGDVLGSWVKGEQ